MFAIVLLLLLVKRKLTYNKSLLIWDERCDNIDCEMKKCFLLLFALLLFVADPVLATTTEKMIPPIVDPSDPMLLPVFGEDHAYSLILRGNGDAVVNMRVAFSNFEETAKKEVVLNLNGLPARDISVFQIIREKRCVNFDQSAQFSPISSSVESSPSGSTNNLL